MPIRILFVITMKILFLNTNIGYGGASKQMVWVANQCASSGHDVTFLTYRDSAVNQILLSSVGHVHIQLESVSGGGKGIIQTVRCLHRFIKRGRFDVAVGFLSPSQLRLALACIGTKTKLLFSHRGDPYQHVQGGNSNFIGKLTSWAFNRADWYVFQTPMAQKAFSTEIRNRSSVIANTISPLHRNKDRSEGVDKIIVSVGRLDVHQKRQDLLIDAFANVVKQYPDYTLELYGDGNDEQLLRERASNCPQIHFMGKTMDVASAIQQATMLVLSSDFEGIPNALLEAMSIGVPCVSTDCSPGGASMLIKDGVNGLLVPRGNVNALLNAMIWYIEHPEEREKMGQKGMQVNEDYAETLIQSKWLETLDKVLITSK